MGALDILDDQLSQAGLLYTRSLFYTCETTWQRVPRKKRDESPTSEWVSSKSDKSAHPGPIEADLTEDDDPSKAKIALVSALLSNCYARLSARYAEIAQLYERMRELAGSKKYNIQVADRPKAAVKASAESLAQIMKQQTSTLERYHDKSANISAVIQAELSAPIWHAIHEYCSCLMNEINYLSKRTDEIQHLVNGNEAQLGTRTAIRQATWAIVLSLIGFIVSTIFSYLSISHTAQGDTDARKQFESPITNFLKAIESDLQSIKSTIPLTISSSAGNLQKSDLGGLNGFLEKFEDVRKQLESIKRLLEAQFTASNGGDASAIIAEIAKVEAQIITLEKAAEDNQSLNSKAFKSVLDELLDINHSIQSLQKTFEHKKI